MPRLSCLLIVVLALLAVPSAAVAGPGQLALIQDDGLLLNSGPEARARALDEVASLGVGSVKIQLTWHSVAPGGRVRPRGFDGGDVSAYRDEAWARYDDLIRRAGERGLRVLVALAPPAPGWATAPRGDSAGVDRPDPREFARWVRAVGTRYSGRHSDGQGQVLPRVDFWSIWNEPNHPQFLLPLGRSNGVLEAPHLYRRLVAAAVDGLRRSGHRRDTILWGEILPIGRADVGRRKTIKPVAFLREFFCLDRGGRPYRGWAARTRGCQSFRRVSGVTGFAYHPYTRPDGPSTPEPTADDATVRSLDRISRALDLAAARGRLLRRGMPVYVTEFAYQSRPPDPDGAALRRIPGFMAEGERLAWSNRRVRSWSQYLLRDEPALPARSRKARFRLFQSGLRSADLRPKPGVYEAYRSPFVVRSTPRGAVELWGAARPLRAGETVQIEQARFGGFAPVLGGRVTVGRGGYFRTVLRVSPAHARFRFTYLDRGIPRASRSARTRGTTR